MACNKIYGEKGKVAAVVCGGKSEEWEKMCRELEEREQKEEKENDNE